MLHNIKLLNQVLSCNMLLKRDSSNNTPMVVIRDVDSYPATICFLRSCENFAKTLKDFFKNLQKSGFIT